jgi:hypothetical protein
VHNYRRRNVKNANDGDDSDEKIPREWHGVVHRNAKNNDLRMLRKS